MDQSTWKGFFKKARIIAVYLWPRDSRLLQLNALFCVALVVIMRLNGLFVPIYSSKISKQRDMCNGPNRFLNLAKFFSQRVVGHSGKQQPYNAEFCNDGHSSRTLAVAININTDSLKVSARFGYRSIRFHYKPACHALG